MSLKFCTEKNSHLLESKRLDRSDETKQYMKKLKAVFETRKTWPNGSNIWIYFMSDGSNVERIPPDSSIDIIETEISKLNPVDAVKKVLKDRIQPLVNLNIIFTEDIAQSSVRIDFIPSDGAWSYIGIDCLDIPTSEPTMNLGWLDSTVIIHEMCHCLGMIHEHSSPINNPVVWDEQAVINWARNTQGWDEATARANIIERYSTSQVNGSEFDPESIMLYFFPASITKNGVGTKANPRLSPKDVIYLSMNYPGGALDPEDYYNIIYGKNIEESLDSSEMQGGEESVKINFTLKVKEIIDKYGQQINIFLVLLVLLVGIIYFSRRKKNIYTIGNNTDSSVIHSGKFRYFNYYK